MGDRRGQPGGGGQPQQVDEVGQRVPDRPLRARAAPVAGGARGAPHQPTAPSSSDGWRDDADGEHDAATAAAAAGPGGHRRRERAGARRGGRGPGDVGGDQRRDPAEHDGGHPALRVMRAIQQHTERRRARSRGRGRRGRRGGEQEARWRRARPWRRARRTPAGAAARTAAEARAWVARARASAADLVALAEGGGDAVDGSGHLAAAAGADGERGGDQAHVAGRAGRTPPTPPSASATGRAVLDRPGDRAQLRAERARRPRRPARPAPVPPPRRPGATSRADRARRGAAGRGGGVAGPAARGRAASSDRCCGARRPTGAAWGDGSAPRRRAPSRQDQGRDDRAASSGAVTCTTAGRAAACPERAGRGGGGRAARRARPAAGRAGRPARRDRSPRRPTRSIARPPPVRATCTTRSSEELSWSRTAAIGRSSPAESTITSSRRRASSGRVGVARGQRALVARVHRPQHVDGLGSSDLADDDPVGAHAEGVAHELADRGGAEPVGGGRAGLEAHDVGAGQAELGGVLHGDDALAVGEQRAERVEHGGLAGAGAAAHDHVGPGVRPPRRGARPRRAGRARRGGCGALRTGGS